MGGGLPAAKGGHPLSDHVMAGLDESHTQQRLAREQAAEDEVEIGGALPPFSPAQGHSSLSACGPVRKLLGKVIHSRCSEAPSTTPLVCSCRACS